MVPAADFMACADRETRSDAVVAPGTFLPITEIERISNCYIVGTCG